MRENKLSFVCTPHSRLLSSPCSTTFAPRGIAGVSTSLIQTQTTPSMTATTSPLLTATAITPITTGPTPFIPCPSTLLPLLRATFRPSPLSLQTTSPIHAHHPTVLPPQTIPRLPSHRSHMTHQPRISPYLTSHHPLLTVLHQILPPPGPPGLFELSVLPPSFMQGGQDPSILTPGGPAWYVLSSSSPLYILILSSVSHRVRPRHEHPHLRPCYFNSCR